MKKILLTLCLYLVITIGNSQTKIDSTLVRPDNDYVTYYDSACLKEKTPAPIQKQFAKIVSSYEIIDDAYAYKINISNHIKSYILITHNFFSSYAYFFFYDAEEQSVNNQPIKINLKWAYNSEEGFSFKLLTTPLMELTSDNNGTFLILKERIHNGTFNAVVSKVYELKNDLSYRLKCCFESTSIVFMENECTITRELKGDKIISYKKTQTGNIYLGMIQLNREKNNIVARECISNEYADYLLCSFENEDVFFKQGYLIEY